MNSQETIRSFLALPLDHKTQQQLIKQQIQCREKLEHDNIIWSSPKNFHITLCFFGNINDKQIHRLSDQLTKIARQQPGLTLTIEPPTPFPSLKKAHVIAARVSGDDQFEHLITQIKTAASKTQIQTDARPFKGHITLGRCRKRHCPKSTEILLPDHTAIKIHTNTMVLFQSELTHNGPLHTALAHFPFHRR